ELYPSRNWPDRVGELFELLCQRDPNLAAALVDDPKFTLPAQAMFGMRMPVKLQAAAAQMLLAAAKKKRDARWTPEFVRLVATLPARESKSELRKQWNDFTLRDSILLALAKEPVNDDRPRFVEGLNSAEPKVVEECAKALAAGDEKATPAEIAAV